MTRKIYFILCLFLGLYATNLCNAFNSLNISDPQWPWYFDTNGTIEKATFTVQPRGLYTEINMYLTFSARDLYFYEDALLEVVLDFDLPEGAIVFDSWLWIEEEIIRAEILDRDVATDIFEEIVGRNQDPSILYKDSPTQYQLRIYPMATDGQRKVKIAYLVPNKWSLDEVEAALPMHILKTSLHPVDLEIIAWENNEWQNIRTTNEELGIFQSYLDGEWGEIYEVLLIDNAHNISNLALVMDAPLTKGLYMNHYQGDTEDEYGFYQLAVNAQELFDLPDTIAQTAIIELNSSLEDGFTFQRYDLAQNNSSSFTHQVGRYTGDFPFELSIIALLQDGTLMMDNIFINENAIHVADSLAEEVWVGQYLQDLEASTITAELKELIKMESIEQRVLSRHTAFICLEPELGGEVCEECPDWVPEGTGGSDGGGPTAIDDISVQNEVTIQASPNPFQKNTNITLKFAENITLKDAEIRIYNTVGQIVKTFNIHEYNNQQEYTITWNGQDDDGEELAPGTYFFIVHTPQQNYVQRLVYIP